MAFLVFRIGSGKSRPLTSISQSASVKTSDINDSLDTFSDRTFVLTSLLSAAAIIVGTELEFFHRILDTVSLSGGQWAICIGAGLLIVAVSEIRKLVLRHREPAASSPSSAPVGV